VTPPPGRGLYGGSSVLMFHVRAAARKTTDVGATRDRIRERKRERERDMEGRRACTYTWRRLINSHQHSPIAKGATLSAIERKRSITKVVGAARDFDAARRCSIIRGIISTIGQKRKLGVSSETTVLFAYERLRLALEIRLKVAFRSEKRGSWTDTELSGN